VNRKAVVIGWLSAMFIRVLALTWRVRVAGQIDVGPNIYALLHGNLLLPAFQLRSCRGVVLISRHRDGELIAQAIKHLGYQTVRGSSTRGAASAVREMRREHETQPWVVTPDGPKGPRGSVKEGLIRLAQESGRAIHPLVGAAAPAKRFASWDRFTLPWPFARVVVYFGAPMPVPADLDDAGRAAMAHQLEQRLLDSEKEAETALRNW
jgi:lysophospholipid acyltransferase (LPLAT)-like uncharacterized protein